MPNSWNCLGIFCSERDNYIIPAGHQCFPFERLGRRQCWHSNWAAVLSWPQLESISKPGNKATVHDHGNKMMLLHTCSRPCTDAQTKKMPSIYRTTYCHVHSKVHVASLLPWLPIMWFARTLHWREKCYVPGVWSMKEPGKWGNEASLHLVQPCSVDTHMYVYAVLCVHLL